MKAGLIIFLAFAPLASAFAADLPVTGAETFRQANEMAAKDPAAAKALYAQAALEYARNHDESGAANGPLFYNIANAKLLSGDLGWAIYWYLRAAQYTPNDPNLQQNLAYARQLRSDQVEESNESRILHILFFWHYDLSAKIRLCILLALNAVFWGACGAILYVKRPALSRVRMTAGILAALLLGSLAAESIAKATDDTGVIIARETVGRKGDSETYQPSFAEPLHAGTEFSLVEERGGWRHVALRDGRTTWVPASASRLLKEGSGV